MTNVIGAFRDYANVPTDKDAVGKARGLLQYCQLLDKTSRDISQHIKNFSRYFTTSHGTPNEVLPNPGWETLS
jgi:hypothetical protein